MNGNTLGGFGTLPSGDEEGLQPSNAVCSYKRIELPLTGPPCRATGDRGEGANRLLTVEEVATVLHVPTSWVYGRMRKRSLERLPAYRFGKYWRFRVDEILAWIRTHAKEPRP